MCVSGFQWVHSLWADSMFSGCYAVFIERYADTVRISSVCLTVGSLSGTGWGWLWCRAWTPPRPACSHSRHTWGSPRASTYRGPSAGSGPWSSGCSRHSLLAWCPAGRRAFVYLWEAQREALEREALNTQPIQHATCWLKRRQAVSQWRRPHG